ncbi:hypothetical protein JDY09_00285 [Thermoleophilum album]|jgi:hypothetical protein|uniref:hypothetical protein n=1 Tax=Thermoleophilum album TaxID=29539 RepID=UPI00237C7482|nr:hypothetical protein [Thermoleophilum album]WDT93741.1 hypothetical protein JDY09_00285 [Thermoleophilum album]
MGLLEDAIREHLELKRKHGASEEEIRRKEAEAFGPLGLGGGTHGLPARGGESARADAEPAQAAIDTPPEQASARGELSNRSPERPEPAASVSAGGSADANASVSEAASDDPLASEFSEPGETRDQRSSAAAPTDDPPVLRDSPPVPAENTAAVDPVSSDRWGGDWVSEAGVGEPFAPPRAEPALFDEALVDAGGDAADAPPPVPTRGTGAESPGLGGAPTFEPTAAHDPAADEERDLLDETPDFLRDTPEHDRLWFEHGPPRDFDFD